MDSNISMVYQFQLEAMDSDQRSHSSRNDKSARLNRI